MSPGDGHVTLFIITLIVKPLIALSVIGLLIAVFAVKSKHGRWFAWPAKSLIALVCIVTLDIPLKLTSLAIHCAFWTGLHVEPGKVVQPRHGTWCEAECVQALVERQDNSVALTATYPRTRWMAGESWTHAFRLTDENDRECMEDWDWVIRSLHGAHVDLPVDIPGCLRNEVVAGTKALPLYELRDEFDQTNPESIFWFTFKRGFEVWDIEADQMIAWFRGYEIRLWWLYPLELGCPANRSLLTDNVVVLEPIQS